MKLALIRRRFSARGGAELYLERLLQALAERGHELHLFAEAWNQTPANVRVHAVRVSGSRATRPVRFADAVERELAAQRFDCVLSLERTRRQDVYRAGDGLHRVWLQRRREFAPVWEKPFVGLGAFHRNMLRLEAETLDPANTRHIIVNSEMVKREILAHFSVPAERIHLVRNGVDVARFQSGKRAETRARFGVKDDEFLLLFVGSGWERKGLGYLLAAMRRIWSTTLLRSVAGGLRQGGQDFLRAVIAVLQGSERTACRQDASPSMPANKVKMLVVGKGQRPLGVPSNVIFADTMTDVENAYAAADLFVFLPIYEPSANVVVEALAAGLPVVTSAQNGAGELIEENVNGSILSDPSDLESIVRTIARWWSRRFYAPPVRVAELSLDRNVSETLAILEMAAKEKSK